MKSRLHKDERYEQLLELAHQIIDEEGTDALTLISLADKAGVTKPIPYRHFGNRKSLLYTLFQDVLKNLSRNMREGINQEAHSLDDAIDVFAKTYMSCFSEHGKSCFSVIAALQAYPEYAKIDLELQAFFCRTLAASLAPFLPKNRQVPDVTLMMIFGATCCVGNMFLNQLISKEDVIKNITHLMRKLINDEE